MAFQKFSRFFIFLVTNLGVGVCVHLACVVGFVVLILEHLFRFPFALN